MRLPGGRSSAAGGLLMLAVAAVATVPAFGHGASEGLHLHLAPEPARPGDTVTVSLDAAEELVLVVIGIVDGPWTEAEPEPPARDLELTLPLPEDASGRTVSIHAAAETRSGAALRASAILRLERTTAPGIRATP